MGPSRATIGGCGELASAKSKPCDLRLGKPDGFVPGSDVDEWEVTFIGFAGTVNSELPELLRQARKSPDPGIVNPTQTAGEVIRCITC